MSDDKRTEYDVTIGGVPHTLLLTSDDAKRYGDDAKPAKSAGAENKAGAAKNKSA